MAHQVIISYSNHDKLQADAICNRLESKGIRCWIAPRDVPVGSEYAESIVKAIESSEVLVLVYSANADKSSQVRREVERAVHSEVKIVPVRIEDTKMSGSFEYYVGSIHWLDAITPPFEQHIDKLVTQVRALLAKNGEEAIVQANSQPVTTASTTDKETQSPADAKPAAPAGMQDGGKPSRRGRSVMLAMALVLAVIVVAGYLWLTPGSSTQPVVDEPPVPPVVETPRGAPTLTLAQVEDKYGPDARMAVDCVRKHPAGGKALHDCVVTGPARYCWEQGLQAPANCPACGVNRGDCERMSALYDRLRAAGVIPKLSGSCASAPAPAQLTTKMKTNGVIVGSHCFYLANGGESCTAACRRVKSGGVCDAAGLAFAAQSVDQCKSVVGALGGPDGLDFARSGQYPDDDSGCTYGDWGKPQDRWVQVMKRSPSGPSCDAVNADSSRMRVCACQ